LLDADRWFARSHLLDSPADARHFVAEIDNDGHAHLRYGDDNLGVQPAARLRFLASYRTSYGPAGNVGAETITHLAYYRHRPDGIQSVRNPLPAAGGTAPEPLANVKLYAPHAFRQRLERAVLASDYADIVLRDFPAQVQRAHAELQWTGSGYEALVALDVLGGTRASPDLLAEIEAHLAFYRRIGHNLAVRPAHQAGLVVEMEVCAAPEFLPEHVKEALLDVFSNRWLVGGGLGFFHPDRLTFGQGIRRSDIVAEAMKVPGVLSIG
jgi:predicted phage baseplate assembly protein